MLKYRHSLKLLLTAFVLLAPLAAPTYAQPDDESDWSPKKARERANLTVHIDRDGVVRAGLSVQVRTADPDVLEQAFLRSFAFPLVVDQEAKKRIAEWEAEAGKRIEFTSITANSSEGLPIGHRSGTSFDFTYLAGTLKRMGVKTLAVYLVSDDKIPNLQLTGAHQRSSWGVTFAQKEISTESPRDARIDLAWGYQTRNVWFELLPVAVFILIPVGLTLWMSWSVTRIDDVSRMWGRYLKFLMWLLNLSWILWLPVYSWSRLSEMIRVVLGSRAPLFAEVVSVLFAVGPPFVACWLCHLVSGRVYRRVRGVEWSPSAVVRNVLLVTFVWMTPILLFMMFMWSFGRSGNGRFILILGLIVFFPLVFFVRKRPNMSVYSVTSGELRDRIFELADKARVKLNQIYVLPDNHAQLSNAFARSDNAVMLTASLLKHMSKREVDVVMAHEIGHLKEKHPQRKSLISIGTFVAASFAAAIVGSMIPVRGFSGVMFSLSIIGATLVLHFFSRSNERHADAIGIGLTGDPEAFISGMAKMERLNLMPMHAGGWGEVFSTHPHTLGRLQDIAQTHGIHPNRFQKLVSPTFAQEPQYLFTAIKEAQTKAFSTDFKQKQMLKVGLVVLAAIILVPAAVAYILAQFDLHGMTKWLAYLGGAIASFLFYQVLKNFVAGLGSSSLEQQVRARISQRGFNEAAAAGTFVGLAPAAQPSRFEKCTVWDVGIAWLVNDRLFYVGEEMSFGLTREQIVATRLSTVEPGWPARTCLFIDWRDEARGAAGTFYLAASGTTILGTRRKMASLAREIEAWRKSAANPMPVAKMPKVPSPYFREVTSEPAIMGVSLMILIKNCATLFLFAAGIMFVLGVSFWIAVYTITVMLSFAVVDELPKLFRYGFAKPPEPVSANRPTRPYQPGLWADSETAFGVEK